MSEWKEYHLEGLCSLITDGKHGDCQNEAESGYYFLSVKDISDNRLIYDNARQITELDFLETHRRTNLKPGDILFTNTGTIGRMAIAPDDPKTSRTTFQKSVAILKPKQEIVIPKFLYYLLKFDNTRLSALAAGTTQKNLLLKDFRSFKVQIPGSQTQKAIARILSSLDDKIELNRRMNETLEEMARAIFKDWFIDFGPTRAKQAGRAPYLPEPLWSLFPEAIDDETGLPIGWRFLSLGEMGKIVTGKTPSTKVPEYFGGDIPFITPSDMEGGKGIHTTTRYLTDLGVNTVKSSLIPAGSIAVSCIGSDMGKVVYALRESITNQQINSVVLSKEYSNEYLYYDLIGRKAELQNLSRGGSAVPILNKTHFSQIKSVIPSHPLLRKFDLIAKSITDKDFANEKESRTLAETRDRLLPKLMSGEIRVKEAEKMVEEVL